MGNIDPMESFEALKDALSLTAQQKEFLKNFNFDNYKILINSFSEYGKINFDVSDITMNLTNTLLLFDESNINQITSIGNALNQQWDTLAKIAESFQTPEIVRLQESLLQNDYSGIYSFIGSLNSTYIDAPNIALLKNAHIFDTFSNELPRGLTSIVKSLHVDTAKRLAHSESISLDVPSKAFYVKNNPTERASISETNVICSSLKLLADLTEDDLIEFLNYLSKYPNLALKHRVGKQIDEIIGSWDNVIDFDYSIYYHARALPENECPYTEAQMLQAPSGMPMQGRYNHTGHSHYYFSNTSNGAIAEVSKHSRESKIQIATLKPAKSVKMIDLSQEVTARNKFLDYCRFKPKPDDNSKVKREYLIPCFVTDCCKTHGIEGIKYYGSKEYINYVVWDDTYFECDGFKIQNRK